MPVKVRCPAVVGKGKRRALNDPRPSARLADMRYLFVICLTLPTLAACGDAGLFGRGQQPVDDRPAEAVAPAPPPDARTVDDFDTTTAEDRAAAAAPVSQPEQELGRTIASLGDPTDPGFWIRTPLVPTAGKGRLEDPASGKSVQVDLIPLTGDPGAGSQVSLPALRLLGVPLTGLPELVVYQTNG